MNHSEMPLKSGVVAALGLVNRKKVILIQKTANLNKAFTD